MKKLLNMSFVLTTIFCLMVLCTGNVEAAKQKPWQVPQDFLTIQDAMDSPMVQDGDTIIVKSGSHEGAYVTKSVEIRGTGNAVIDSGPMHPAGLSMGFRMLTGSDGATITNLVFEVDLAIMNGDAVDDVTVDHCTFFSAIQAISNWRGSGWIITHNDIVDLRTRCGGGIGILVADHSGGDVTDNLISHNKIFGTLFVSSGDCGGYDGSGIVLYADFRWGRTGAQKISWNRVIKNKVSLESDTPSVVDVWAFELTDTRDDPNTIVIHDNAIGFNDFRGTANQIALTPIELGDFNSISRNLGDNRGHGLHPGIFFK